jgi:uncharacterized repeat protein (TIGR03803 family)
MAGLILSKDTLYGTASAGGGSGYGTVYALSTDGTVFRTLHSFDGQDGSLPNAGLTLSGNTLYGTTSDGVTNYGTFFKINTDGTGFEVLHSFNGDGTGPNGDLIVSDGTLYGTVYGGGSSGYGAVVRLNTEGTGYTNLYSFSAAPPRSTFPFVLPGTNSDGCCPKAGLISSGNTLYGTTSGGGTLAGGTVFMVNSNGTGFMTLHDCLYGGIDDYPESRLLLLGTTLYGTTHWGAVFSLSLSPQLSIVPSGHNMILTWPTNYSGFNLQSATNLGSATVWTTNLPAPVVVNGQNTVTNPVSGREQFFRLNQ